MGNTVKKKKAKRLKRRWSLYPNNRPLPAANLLILACTQDGATQLTTRYEIEYLCCGRKETLNHQSIRYRASKKRVLCRFCVYKHNSEIRRGGRRPAYDAPYGAVMPDWPVPPTSQALRFVW